MPLPELNADSRRMRVALRRVGRMQFLRGNITLSEWRDVRSVVWNPIRKTQDGTEVNLLDEVSEEVRCQLVARGCMGENDNLYGLDWDTLLDFLRELMPLILEFIQALLLIFTETPF